MKETQILNPKLQIQNLKLQTKIHWVYLLVIFGIVLGIYIQTVKYDFVNFDDKNILIDNQSFFTTDFSIKKIFTTNAFINTESILYRPLQNLSFALDAYIADGIYPWSFHLSNLVLFFLIGVALYLLLLKLKITPCFALLGTLLVISSPLNVWSVVWVPARGDLLLTLFTLLAFVCFISFIKTNSFIDLLLTSICFSLALFTKETAAVILPLFLFYFAYDNCEKNIRNLFQRINCKHIFLACLMLGVGLLWFYLRYDAIIQIDRSVLLKDFIYNLQNFPVALSQLIIPYEMSPFPRFTFAKIILGGIILVLLMFFLVKKTEIPRWEKVFFLMWFLLFLFPAMFIRLKHIDYLEHRYLLPQIGILIFLIKTINFSSISFHSSKRTKYFKSPTTLTSHHFIPYYIILLIFATTSHVKARTLQNPITVVEAIEKYNGIGVYPLLNRGVYFIDKNMYEKAANDFSKVLQLDPNNFTAYKNLAHINLQFGNYTNAITLYSIFISINNGDYSVYESRSRAKFNLGNYEGALLDLDSAIMINKNSAFLYNNRGVLKNQIGYVSEALLDFEQAVKLSNYINIDMLYNSAFVKNKLGDTKGALHDCDKALQVEPDNEDILLLKNRLLSKINIY